MALQKLVSRDFENALESASGVVIVGIYADWTPMGKMHLPIFRSLADEYDKHIDWYLVDFDKNPDIVKKYKAITVPTLLVFIDSYLVHSVEGAKPKAVLLEELAKYL